MGSWGAARAYLYVREGGSRGLESCARGGELDAHDKGARPMIRALREMGARTALQMGTCKQRIFGWVHTGLLFLDIWSTQIR